MGFFVEMEIEFNTSGVEWAKEDLPTYIDVPHSRDDLTTRDVFEEVEKYCLEKYGYPTSIAAILRYKHL